MADRMVLDTEVLDLLIKQLRSLSFELSDCADALKRIAPGRSAGGELSVPSFSCRLQCISALVESDTVAVLLHRLRRLLDETGDYASFLGMQLRRAGDLIEDTEISLVKKPIDTGTQAVFSQESGFSGRISLPETSSPFMSNAPVPALHVLAKDEWQELITANDRISLIIDGCLIGSAIPFPEGKTVLTPMPEIITLPFPVIPIAQPAVMPPVQAFSRLGMQNRIADMFENVCHVGLTAAFLDVAASVSTAVCGTSTAVLHLTERCLYELIDGVI